MTTHINNDGIAGGCNAKDPLSGCPLYRSDAPNGGQFDDNDYRQHSFSIDDPVAKDISDHMDDKVNDFWNNKLPEAKKILAEKGNSYLPEKKWR